MHAVPRYTLPPVVSTLDPGSISGLKQTVNPKASSGATTGTNSSTSGSGLGTTFLNLLSTELQNQDPTAPVDSTAMVGQMISLNQLDQLISINQTLSGAGAPTTTGSAQPAKAASSVADAGSVSPSASNGPANQLPFNPDTMMPVNPALSPTLFDPSKISNYTSGGK